MMKLKSTVRALLALFALMLGGMVTQAHAAPGLGDYDGDGISDLAVAEVNRPANSTIYFVRLTASASPISYIFNAAADALITGRFFKNISRDFPGAVIARGAGQPLEWRIKNPSGTENVLSYGSPGDTIPNQGDLDCDGVTDLVVARSGAANFYPGFKLWYVALSSTPGYVQQLLFGLAGDRVATADMDGDGCSELVVLRNNFVWYSRKLFADSVSEVQWGLPGDIPLVPQDIDGDGGADYAISRVTGPTQTAFIRFSNGSTAVETIGGPTSVPFIGSFIGSPFFAWSQRNTGFTGVLQANRSVAVFPFGLATNHMIRPDGTVVPPNESGAFGTAVVNTAVAAPAAPVATSSGVRCDGELRKNDGSGGFVNSAGNSKGTLKIIFPSGLRGRVRNVKTYSGGRLFDELDLYTLGANGGLEWGGRERWYGNKGEGSYPDNLLVQAELSDGRMLCVTLPNPQQRYD